MKLTPAQRGLAEGFGAALAGLGAWVWWLQPSPHFTWAELTTTETGLPNKPNAREKFKLIRLAWTVLEPLRSQFGPIRVTSAFRSEAVNEAVGGSATSSHRDATAVDLYDWDAKASNEDIAGWLWENRARFPSLDQVIVEHHTGHLHVGTAPNSVTDTPRQSWKQTWDGNSYSSWSPDV